MSQEWYTLRELESLLRVDRGTIRYHQKRGHVKPVKVFVNGRKKLLFSFADYQKLTEILSNGEGLPVGETKPLKWVEDFCFKQALVEDEKKEYGLFLFYLIKKVCSLGLNMPAEAFRFLCDESLKESKK